MTFEQYKEAFLENTAPDEVDDFTNAEIREDAMNNAVELVD